MHMEIPAQVEWLLAQLKNGGYEAYAVGGCVRDTLLGRLPEDWDITTSAKPEQVKEIFGKTIDTGLKHGTVTVLRDGVGYEITTYRIDGEYEDGRHPREVAFTMELKEDLRRRDFTINAMAYSRETGLVDIFGGVQDLKGGVIRCVGDAVERFTEDALRILRAIRFSAQLDFDIEQATYGALSVIAPNLRRISKERIQSELIKTLLSDCPERILLVNETGMAPCICPDFQMVYEGFEKKYGPACAGKLRSISALDRDKALRLAAFLHPVGEVKAVKILKDLKLDNDTIGRVRTLVGWFEEPISYELSCIRRVMSAMSDSLFDDLLTLKLVLRPEQKSEIETFKLLAQAVRKNGDCIRLGDLAVDGKDLMGAGMKPGKKLGEKLDELFLLVLEHPEFNEKNFLLSAVRDGMRD